MHDVWDFLSKRTISYSNSPSYDLLFPRSNKLCKNTSVQSTLVVTDTIGTKI